MGRLRNGPVRKRLRVEEKLAGTPRAGDELLPKDKASAPLTVETCRFLKWELRPVLQMGASTDHALLVVARTSGLLEMRAKAFDWEPVHKRGDGTEADVSGICFVDRRQVWITRMNGMMELYDATIDLGFQRVCQMQACSSAIWGIAASPKSQASVAISCDDGCLRFVSADPHRLGDDGKLPDNELGYTTRASTKVSSRALCLDWVEDTVVSGDASGGVRWIRSSDGGLIGRGAVPSACIWCVRFAKGGRQVLTGDSRGYVVVWASASQTVLQEIHIENTLGDILSIASSRGLSSRQEVETVYVGSASGAIGGLSSQAASAAGETWTPLRGRSLHTHDVRALVCVSDGRKNNDPVLLSGAMDSLILSHDTRGGSGTPSYHRDFGCWSAQPWIQFIRDPRVLMVRYENRIDMWRLHLPSSNGAAETLFFSMRVQTGEGNLRSCCVSPDLRIVVAVTTQTVRLLSVEPIGESASPNDETSAISQWSMGSATVRIVPMEDSEHDCMKNALVGAPHVAFTRTSTGLCLIGTTQDRKSLILYSGLSGGRSYTSMSNEMRTLSMKWMGLSRSRPSVIQNVVAFDSNEGKIAVYDTAGSIAVLQVSITDAEVRAERIAQLQAAGLISALCFSPCGRNVAVASRRREVQVLGLMAKTKQRIIVPRTVASPSTTVCFSPNGRSILLAGGYHCAIASLIGDTAHITADRKGEQKTPSAEHPREDANDQNVVRACWHLKDVHGIFLAATVPGPQHLLVVKKRWSDALQTLPAAVARKRFGM